MIVVFPGSGNLRSSTRTTAGTLVTIPAGKMFTCDIYLQVGVAVAGNTVATVTVNGANADPAAGSIAHRIQVNGLALSTVSESGMISLLCQAPAGNDITLDLGITGGGSVSCTVNGLIY